MTVSVALTPGNIVSAGVSMQVEAGAAKDELKRLRKEMLRLKNEWTTLRALYESAKVYPHSAHCISRKQHQAVNLHAAAFCMTDACSRLLALPTLQMHFTPCTVSFGGTFRDDARQAQLDPTQTLSSTLLSAQ